MKKNVLIALGNRRPQLTKELVKVYQNNGYHVLQSQAENSEDIHSYMEAMQEEFGAVDIFIYIAVPPYEASILDGRLEDRVFRSMREDLETGLWWLQAVAKSMICHGIKGRILLQSHISALVPTQKFSYCSTGQAALLNVGRVAVLELSKYGICTNFIALGWSEQKQEEDFAQKLRKCHEKDQFPLLPDIDLGEVAQACLQLSNPDICVMNGALISLDGGFSVSRFIREIKE